ncbi:MAG: NAD(P)H-hydrate epimerase [Lachnospiraceae bacterium]|nr:NAD(P)H-hydrate epimerase [Lachnospiraceae bacterium]
MNLERFIKAQEKDYDVALSEIRSGRKRSHWIWYIFPQIKGLGFSSTSEYYGIDGYAEAKAYYANPILRERLLEISGVLLTLKENDAGIVMGYPDDLKLCSSMTLFSEIAADTEVFGKVLEKYFNGQKDVETLKRLAISVDRMRQSDAYTIENITSGRELMYRAASGVYASYDGWKNKRIAIVCGGGNNGGDGYALSVILRKNGMAVDVFAVSDKLSEDGKYYCHQAMEMGIQKKTFDEETHFKEYDIVVDCIFGTGFHGEVRGAAREAIAAINEAGAYVISVDINSGLNGDTGEGKLAVYSDLTVSIGYYKRGLFEREALSHIKKLVNVDIGIELIA